MSVHNIPARSRQTRRSVKDKEAWEKERLKQRKEGFIRIDPSVTGSAMTVYEKGTQGFLSEADRFHTDVAGEEKVHRDALLARKLLIQEKKRYENLQREENRWNEIQIKKELEEKKWQDLRNAGTKSKRNANSVPFNPITLKYNDGLDGQRLKESDDRIRWRASMRAQNLQKHNSREGINPITGKTLALSK